MVEPLRHRQTKEAETRMPDLTPPRHIPTLPGEAIRGPARPSTALDLEPTAQTDPNLPFPDTPIVCATWSEYLRFCVVQSG